MCTPGVLEEQWEACASKCSEEGGKKDQRSNEGKLTPGPRDHCKDLAFTLECHGDPGGCGEIGT